MSDDLVARLESARSYLHNHPTAPSYGDARAVAYGIAEIERLRREVSQAHGVAQACEQRAERAEAEREALREDAERWQWAKEILAGDDTPEADKKAMAIAHQLMLGVATINEAVDRARKGAK